MRVEEKAEVVEGLRDRFARATITIVAEPRGLSVAQVTRLRRRMRGVSAEYKIAKNTLLARAVDSGEHAPLRSMLVGQTALIFGYGDPVVVAKEVRSYTKENEERISIKGGMLEGQLFAGEAVSRLADLGTKEQIRAQLLGVLLAPATQLVRLLNEPARLVARVLAARAEAGGAPTGQDEAVGSPAGEPLTARGEGPGSEE